MYTQEFFSNVMKRSGGSSELCIDRSFQKQPSDDDFCKFAATFIVIRHVRISFAVPVSLALFRAFQAISADVFLRVMRIESYVSLALSIVKGERLIDSYIRAVSIFMYTKS